MSKLRSDSPAERREAALYMGEAAVSEAVNDLIDLYETDDDRKVRRAAAYALGQFKAIDVELSKGQHTKVEALLKRVEFQGKLGKRAAVGAAVQVSVILLVLLLLLLAANLFAPQLRERLNDARQIVEGVNEPRRDRDTLIADAETYFISLRTDVETLVGEYQRVMGGDNVSCEQEFGNQTAYKINPADASENPDLREVFSSLNTVRESLQTSAQSYAQTCADGATLDVASVGELMRPLVELNANLTEIETSLSAAGGDVAPTPIPTSEPVGSEIVRAHLPSLHAILEQVTAINGAAVQLVAYWGEAANTNATGGCDAPRPPIPDNYTLSTEDTALSNNLTQAVNQINAGLDAVRNGWNQLESSCQGNTIGAQARAGLINASAASDSFELARQLLALVENGEF
ncbi:MAG: HEAT repeat domain-containing protein [Anaerolineae bacterium]|nr:HEAT repeat domain-containing protein [Anaerolineae bacterium]